MKWWVRPIIVGVIVILIELFLVWAMDKVLAYASGDVSVNTSVISPADESTLSLTPTPTPTPITTPSPGPDFDYDELMDRISKIDETMYLSTCKIMISIWALSGVFLGFYLIRDTLR